MNATGAPASRRVALLFTRFPVSSETFLQREVAALRQLGLDLRVLSMWPTPPSDKAGPQPDLPFSPWELLTLFWWIPYWAVRRPAVLNRFATSLVSCRMPTAINIWETLLGFGYALVRARSLAGKVDHLHAVWASAPATAAWALHHLAGIPYSMAGHAYDLFERGGDGLLACKIPEARFIRTSTRAGRERWISLGARADQVRLVRRGILGLPAFTVERMPAAPFRLLAVGRLVEKMGYPQLLDILARLRRAGLPFTATLVGGGPQREELESLCRRLHLEDRVRFTGALPFSEVSGHLSRADLFLYTGQVARSGDRAGFPNAIGEAMAWGVPVCAAAVGAVAEGIRQGETGLLFNTVDQAVEAVTSLLASPADYARMRLKARQWAEREFDAAANMRELAGLLVG